MSGDQYSNCTAVSLACPVEATTYGYAPNLPANVILLTILAIAAISHCGLGIYYRLWSFGTCITLGCLMESIGYIGRLMMHNNPWYDVAFKIQVVCLIVAPSFLAAGIYLTVKHLVLALGPQLSRLPAKLYTWIFISCDVLSIVIQSIGGGMASGANDQATLNTGNNLMIAGIGIQVGTMALCIICALDFGYSLWKKKASSGVSGTLGAYTTTRRFYYYLVCTCVAFILIFIRCIYRLPEMLGGWGNPLMRNETEFMILDGTMITIAAILLTAVHPGYFFPAMRQQAKKQQPQPEIEFESKPYAPSNE